jgi:hypothetical protein
MLSRMTGLGAGAMVGTVGTFFSSEFRGLEERRLRLNYAVNAISQKSTNFSNLAGATGNNCKSRNSKFLLIPFFVSSRFPFVR